MDPVVVYPGINILAYRTLPNLNDPDIPMVKSYALPCFYNSKNLLLTWDIRDRITFLSLNRFERKKNTLLAVEAFGALPAVRSGKMRLVVAGGYDPRVADNVECLAALLNRCVALGLAYDVVSPRALPQIPAPNTPNAEPHADGPHVLFVLNFSHAQRTHLLTAPGTRSLLYTPQNEHFGIGPVEAMVCGVPVVACDSGGPTESIVDPSLVGDGQGEGKRKENRSKPARTGYLLPPVPARWRDALLLVLALSPDELATMSSAARARVEEMFSLESLTKGIEGALEEAVRMGNLDVWRGGAGVNVGVMLLGVCFGIWLAM